MDKDLELFLSESNKIEGVTDDDSLQQARYAWDYLIKQKEITPSVILKIHKILMLHQPLMPNERGYFRQEQVRVGGRERTDWHFVPDKIALWCEHFAGISDEPGEEEETIKGLHIIFEMIHPFIDGNGRTGRLLMNWQRVKAGLPILVIKEAEKQKYYDWFK